MKYLTIIAGVLILILVGCDDIMSKSDYYDNDEYLIEQIQNATNKIEIEYSQLPSNAISIIETSYSEDVSLSRMQAPELGYEVTFSDTDIDESLFKEVYFDLDGRKLENKKNKDACFDLIFPVTFIMPDGLSIIVESDSEEDWGEFKAWYDNNPDSKDWPDLQYPADIILEDGTIATINNDGEMESFKLSCD